MGGAAAGPFLASGTAPPGGALAAAGAGALAWGISSLTEGEGVRVGRFVGAADLFASLCTGIPGTPGNEASLVSPAQRTERRNGAGKGSVGGWRLAVGGPWALPVTKKKQKLGVLRTELLGCGWGATCAVDSTHACRPHGLHRPPSDHVPVWLATASAMQGSRGAQPHAPATQSGGYPTPNRLSNRPNGWHTSHTKSKKKQ